MEETGIDNKIPEFQGTSIGKIFLMLLIFCLWTTGRESHQMLDSINGDVDFRSSSKNLNIFLLNTFLPNSKEKIMDKNLLCSILSDILKHFRSLLENCTLDELVGERVLYQKKSSE